MESNQLLITRKSDEPAERALHGTTRAVLANMIHGVSKGFEVVLEIDGVGYRAEMNGQNLALYVGYSHPVIMEPPGGITFQADAKTRQVKVQGYDKEQVGQVAANIRKVRPPEPYHGGKGIHYLVSASVGRPGRPKELRNNGNLSSVTGSSGPHARTAQESRGGAAARAGTSSAARQASMPRSSTMRPAIHSWPPPRSTRAA
jgi:large subunit ribosomal protein L6